MGLRCLLSHDFGEPELEREREEQGNEVVITVNEVKTCTRCGERRVVSENTEVTSIEQLTETATADEAAAPAGDATAADAAANSADASGSVGVTIDDSGVTDDAEVLTDDGAGDDPEELGEATTANMTVDDVESAAAEPVEAADDDGVILSDDTADEDGAGTAAAADAAADRAVGETDAPEAGDRAPGEWPEYDAGDDPEAADREWPEVDEEDEGFSADEPSDEAPEDMTFGGGFTPEITGSEAEAADDDEIELSFTRAQEASVDFEPTVDDIQTEFYCPECGLSRLAGNSSMRAGDICPDCKRGYIDERPV
ncbi:MAG: DUF7093 family protein [Halohasta sp.]